MGILRSLKSRIFVLFVLVILPVLLIALLALVRQIEDREYALFERDLAEARDFASFFLESRLERTSVLGGSIKASVADDAIFARDLSERDIFYAMEPIRDRLDTDLLMAIDNDGMVRGQILRIYRGQDDRPLRRGRETGTQFRYFTSETGITNPPTVYAIQDQYYLFSLNEVEVAGEVIGWIGIGYLLDNHVAQDLSDNYASGYMVKVVQRDAAGRCQLIATSVQLPTLSAANPETCVDLSQILDGVTRAEPYQLAQIGDTRIEVDVYGSMQSLFNNLQEWQAYFSILIAAVLLASLVGAYLIASLIGNPVRQLVQKARYIAEGNYEEPVVINDGGELSELATEINVMQRAVLAREQEIVHRAYHDTLTQLPNRAKLFEVLKDWADEDESSHGLFLIKVNHIKAINESLGHQTGDAVIQFVSEQLRQLTDVHLLSHLRTDEFVILVPCAEANAAKVWVERISSVMAEPYDANGMTLQLNPVIGVALAKGEDSQSTNFLRMADIALHKAKQDKVPYLVFDQSMDQDQAERLALMNDLRIAVTDDQLRLHYQPKLDTRDSTVSQVEALIRWQHPDRGMVRPDKFIEIAESTGQMDNITFWVLEEAARQHRAWLDAGHRVSIAVNISAENLRNERFAELVAEVLERHNLETNALRLEITESAVVDDPQSAVALLSRLRDKGLHISIDDYGTGYSSLAQLKHLPVHELKIDQSFVRDLPHDDNDQIIVKSTIGLAHSMGLTVVAEGVETEESLVWLRDNGCELAQGYLISRPLPEQEFTLWLEQQQQAVQAG